MERYKHQVMGKSNNDGSSRCSGFGNKRRGSALPAVLLAILVLSLLGTGMLSLAFMERQSSANDYKITQASYLAEAGINLALAHLRQDSAWRQGIDKIILPQIEGEIAGVAISTLPASYCLRSVGKMDNLERVLEVHMARPFIDYALAVGSSISLENNITINGDLFSGGNIWLSKGAVGSVAAAGDLNVRGVVKGSIIVGRHLYNFGVIQGDVTVGQGLDKYGSDPNYYGNIYGKINQGHTLSLQGLPADLLAPYGAGNRLPPGEYTLAELQSMLDNFSDDISIFYCDGDLFLNNVEQGEETDYYTGKAIIAVKGDVHLGKNILAANPAAAWAFVAAGDMLLDGGITVEGILACSGCFYKQGGESIINGSLLAGGISDIETEGGNSNQANKNNGRGCIKGELTINYNADKGKILGSHALAVVGPILSWRHVTL